MRILDFYAVLDRPMILIIVTCLYVCGTPFVELAFNVLVGVTLLHKGCHFISVLFPHSLVKGVGIR